MSSSNDVMQIQVSGNRTGIIGLKEVHQTTFGKAIAARLLPLLLCCCCAILLGVVLAMVFGLSFSNPEQLRQFIERFMKP